jgi:hypothetical protein
MTAHTIATDGTALEEKRRAIGSENPEWKRAGKWEGDMEEYT